MLLSEAGELKLLVKLGVLLSDPGEPTLLLVREMLEKLLCLDRVLPLRLLARLGVLEDVLEYIELMSPKEPDVKELPERAGEGVSRLSSSSTVSTVGSICSFNGKTKFYW